MLGNSQLSAVPAFRVRVEGHYVPLIVGIYLEDTARKSVLVPAVMSSIELASRITKLEGVAHGRIRRLSDIEVLGEKYLAGAARAGTVILLLLCDSPDIAEAMMRYVNSRYDVDLVKHGMAWTHEVREAQ
jgi:hypothetical protein